MRAKFEHYRVPEGLSELKKGEPPFTARYFKDDKPIYWQINKPCARGGITICKMIHNGEELAVGEAVCSMSDNFSYKMGRDISYGRANAELRR